MDWQELEVFGAQYRVAGQSDDKSFLNLKEDLRNHQTLNALCDSVLSPASEVCDIGANLGLSSLVMAKHVPGGRVYAFEPGQPTHACLSATIAAAGLGHVTVAETAVGAVEQEAWLHPGEGFSAGSHIVTNRHISNGVLPTGRVRMTTLDSFLETAKGGKIDLIKIDTEGFEIDVLAGAKNTLAQSRPVILLEMNSWCLVAFRNMNPRIFVDFLLDHFPFVFWVKPSGQLRRIGKGVRMHYFLHEHLVRHACVSDLVCCWHTDWLNRFGPGVEA